jgi:hypothetical protein
MSTRKDAMTQYASRYTLDASRKMRTLFIALQRLLCDAEGSIMDAEEISI